MRRYEKFNILVLFVPYLFNPQTCSSSNMDARCDSNISEKSTHELMNILFTDCLKKHLYQIAVISNQSRFKCSLWQPRVSKPYYLVNYEKLMSDQAYSFEENHMFTSKNATKRSSKKYMIFEDMASVNIQHIFEKLKKTHFWNSGSIFIIKMTKVFGSCKLAADFFRIIWHFNAVNGYFICHHPQHGTVLYTFNPYSSFAPKPWILVESYKQENGHPFTIFMNYERKDTCNMLNWDRTRKLSQFPVKLANITFSVDDDLAGESKDIIYQINDIIWNKLEAKMVSKKFPWNDIGNIDGVSGKATKMTASVLRGEYECLISQDFERSLWKNEVNLLTKAGVCFVIRNKLASIFEHLSAAFPMYTWLSFLLLFVSTILLLTYLFKINYQDAATDVLRMTIGNAMIYPSKTNLSRVIAVYLLCIFAIINTHLQSKLQMLLTVEHSHNDLKNLSALVDNGYKIYATDYYWQYYSADRFYREHILIDESLESCLKLTKHNNKISCVDDCYDIKSKIQDRPDLALHQDTIIDKYNIQLFRDDSALKDQFQRIYTKLYESGIPDFLDDIIDSSYRRPRHSYFRAISMFQLSFAFDFILIFQLICSVVFVCEIFRVYERFDFERFFDEEYKKIGK